VPFVGLAFIVCLSEFFPLAACAQVATTAHEQNLDYRTAALVGAMTKMASVRKFSGLFLA
jgi:hypothetical protein